MAASLQREHSPGANPTIALIGCGAIAESFYLPSLHNLRELTHEIVLVDLNIDRARKVGKIFGINRFENDYRSLIGKVDGAIVALPHHLHFPVSKELLARGIHVLTEKPLAEGLKEAKILVELASTNHVTISVNNTRRLMPSNGKVKELVSSRTIGSIQRIEYVDGNEFNWPTQSGFYFDSKGSHRGILMDIGSHVVDLVCWWLDGKPELVSCENDSFGGSESVCSLRLMHHDCTISLRLSRLHRLANTYKIVGTQGVIEGGVYDFENVNLRTGGRNQKLRIPFNKSNQPSRMVIDNFVAVIRGDRKPIVAGEDVLDSIEIIDRAYETARRFEMPWYDTTKFLNDARL